LLNTRVDLSQGDLGSGIGTFRDVATSIFGLGGVFRVQLPIDAQVKKLVVEDAGIEAWQKSVLDLARQRTQKLLFVIMFEDGLHIYPRCVRRRSRQRRESDGHHCERILQDV
jgi:hypothetical protein